MNPRPRDLPALTGLRFVAAIWVVVYHIGVHWRTGLMPASGPVQATLYPLISMGGNAVGLFFVLSGFILTYIYLAPDGRMRVALRVFARARFSRLYPIYLTCLGIALAPLLWSAHAATAAGKVFSIVTALVMLQAWSNQSNGAIDPPAWSLSAEMYFYAVFPIAGFAVVRLARRHPWIVFTSLWIGCVALQSFAYGHFSDGSFVVWHIPFIRLPEFLCGCALARVYAVHPNIMRGRSLLAVAITLGGIFVVCASAPLQNIPGLLVPCWAFLILAATTESDETTGWLASAPLVLLGQASYALYLVHWPLWQWYVVLTGQPFTSNHAGVQWVVVAVYVALTIGVSVLLYRWVEVPCQRLLRAPSSRVRVVRARVAADPGR